MQTEFEATFINIKPDEIRIKLKALGAKQIKPETLIRRVNFFPPNNDKFGWMRVRDEGDKITLSYKRYLGAKNGHKIDSQQEIFLEINSFEEGIKLLESVGAKKKSYQETKRESWRLGEIEFDMDTWPGLEPFLEIEGPNEPTIKEVAEKLQLDYSQAIFGPVGLIYEKMLGIPQPIINNETPEITFDQPPKKFNKK